MLDIPGLGTKKIKDQWYGASRRPSVCARGGLLQRNYRLSVSQEVR